MSSAAIPWPWSYPDPYFSLATRPSLSVSIIQITLVMLHILLASLTRQSRNPSNSNPNLDLRDPEDPLLFFPKTDPLDTICNPKAGAKASLLGKKKLPVLTFQALAAIVEPNLDKRLLPSKRPKPHRASLRPAREPLVSFPEIVVLHQLDIANFEVFSPGFPSHFKLGSQCFLMLFQRQQLKGWIHER